MDAYKGVALGVESAWPTIVTPRTTTKRRSPTVWATVGLLLASVFLASCSTLNAADCGPDWYSIGQRDGRIGAQPQAEFYAQRCSAPVDGGTYLRGWQDGQRMRPTPVV